MTSVLAIVLVLGGLIFFHELGHFLIARVFGMGVKTFSLGFGPRIWGFKPGMTDYRLSAVPLGGYVSLVGESGEDSEDEEDNEFPKEAWFSLRPAWQRICVVAAGPIFNFILAWLIYWGLFLNHGQTKFLPVIGNLQPDGAAQVAGLEPGDRILSINGVETPFWDDMAEMIQESADQDLNMVVERGGQELKIKVTPKLTPAKNIFGETKMKPMIGITSSGDALTTLPLGGTDALMAAAVQTWDVVRLTVQGIVKLVERIVPLESVGGPIMIAQMVSQQAEKGVSNVLALAAVLSINLGLLNLLPIPVLDGGHIMYFTLEIVMRKPVSERVRMAATRVGILIILALMFLAIYNDLQRIFRPV